MMPLPEDNEFDDLIKKAADGYQATGAGPDWEHMQGLLDEHMPVRKKPRKRVLILLIVLFLLLGGGYLYFNKVNEMVSMPEVKEAKTSTATNGHTDPSATIHPNVADTTTIDSKIKQGPLLKNNKQVQLQKEILTNRHNRLKNKAAGNIKINIQPGEVAENNEAAKTGNEETTTNTNESVNSVNDTTTEILEKNDTTHLAIKSLTGKTISTEAVPAEGKTAVDTNNIAVNKPKKNKEKIKHPFEFSLVYAPELTTIGFSDIDKPGSNYGLLAGYHISKNLIIQTGVIRSRKNYIANGSDFKMSYTLPANYKLNKVDGYCMMYEIPLNIKSQIHSGKKLNFFYTAGISSYIMTSEFYVYNISTNNGSYNRNVKYNSQKNYWFSLINAGLGVEKKITNTLDIAASPFVKIPLKGMGEGKLKLLGTGINFLLTYKPAFSKK